MRKQRRLFLLIAFALLWSNPARAEVEEKRLALLIGNDGYSKAVGTLKNSYNDVKLIAKALERDQFKVSVLKDASASAILEATRRFSTSLKDLGANAVGFFYYAGHGAANPDNGENYFLPVDVQNVDTEIWSKSVKVGEIVRILAAASEKATQFVIFDACRSELGETRPGTVRIGFTPIQQEAAMLVGYSTAPGKTAADGTGNNGPYASALATELAKPGLDALLVFANVQRSVWSTTHQDPWINHPTLPEVYFFGQARQNDAKRNEALSLVKRASIDELRGHSEEAAQLYDQAIDLLSDGGWAEDTSMASALNGLAFHYMRQKRYVRALPLFQKSLVIYRRSFGDSHPTVLAIVKELSEIRKFVDKQTP